MRVRRFWFSRKLQISSKMFLPKKLTRVKWWQLLLSIDDNHSFGNPFHSPYLIVKTCITFLSHQENHSGLYSKAPGLFYDGSKDDLNKGMAAQVKMIKFFQTTFPEQGMEKFKWFRSICTITLTSYWLWSVIAFLSIYRE